jgi:hypothetical protein
MYSPINFHRGDVGPITRCLLFFVIRFQVLNYELFIINCINISQSVAALVNMIKRYIMSLKQNEITQ